MIKVRIRPSKTDTEPEIMALGEGAGVSKQVMVDVSIHGDNLATSDAFRLSDGRIVFMFEPTTIDHLLWDQAIPIIFRKLKRRFQWGGDVP